MNSKRFFLGYAALLLVFLPLAQVTLMIAPPVALAESGTDASSGTVVDEEGNTVDLGALDDNHGDEQVNGGADDASVDQDYLAEYESKRLTTDAYSLGFFDQALERITIAPQDEEKLRNYQVDVRVTDYLSSLVLPEELGGYGLKHIKVGRLFKNYDTDGVGKYDRESAEAAGEDARFISSHHRGQAVDISEVGDITCKLVERRHLGGSTTRWQQPRGVKVAWQSVDGISRTPTPKGPSLMEAATTLSADSILRMLNESGEMDAYVDYVRGMDLGQILTYVGMNIMLKNAGAVKITGDPLADGLINTLGWAMLEKSLPGLPDGLVAQDGQESVALATARARMEEALNLPPGSLRGTGWNEVLRNAGKRALENALGLPTLFFEKHSLEEANRLDTVRAALRHLNKGDKAFDFIDGTIDKIQKNDVEGLTMAGVGLIADAFNLTEAQRQELTAAVKQQRRPNVDPTTFAINKEFPIDGLKLFFSDNQTEQNAARQAMIELGTQYLRQAVQKAVPRPFEGVTEAILSQITSRGNFTLEELKRSIGTTKLGYEYGLNKDDIDALVKSGKTGKGETLIASEINKEFKLTGNNQINAIDVDEMAAGKSFRLAEKIGGAEADKAIGWDRGTGYELIKGTKKLEDAAGEIFSNAFGQVLGLEKGTEISLKGDLQKNYGQALIEQRLGLKLDKNSADQFDSKTLLKAFGLSSSRQIAELRDDDSFWNDPDTFHKLQLADARLGITDGTSEKFLRGQIDTNQFSRTTATNNIANVAFDQLWNYFDLGDEFKLKKDEAQLLFDVLKDWDNAGFEKKDQAFQLIHKIIGRTLDARTGFEIDFFITYITGGDKADIAEKLINQGVRQLALAFGVNLEKFDDKDLKTMSERIIRVFNGTASDADKNTLIDQILDATKIPKEFRDDAKAFVDGDFRTGLAAWSAKIWSDFANKYLPPDGRLSYEEIRQTFDFTNQQAIEDRALQILTEGGSEGNLGGLTEEQQTALRAEARRELIQEARDHAQYKISDALLEQATGEDLPADFSKTMFEGTEQQRAELLLHFGLTRIESVLKSIEPSYQEGTLEKILTGKLSTRDADQLVLSIINRSGVSFGPFDSQFINQFYQFIRSQGSTDFYTNTKYNGMWNYFDSWFEKTLGIGDLPAGLTRSVYYASQHGWKLDAGLTGSNGQIIVPSLHQLGENFLLAKVSEFGDKQFGLPAGSTYRIYQAAKSFVQAERAYAAANTAQNAAALGKAQAELTVLIITIALNACDACQQFFASIDKAIAAPPGFTNALVAGAIAMAFGLGPAGLIAAGVIYLVGVYRVDYLCPIPPPDQFALLEFDPDYDKLDYTWGEYYNDGTKVVKDSPAKGENPFDWDDGLPFANGNDPNLWRAWARYNTGRLIDATLDYGEQRIRPNKPLQVITLRQANVEFFYPRSAGAFGRLEQVFPSVGLGYSQKTTKTTDWVHVGFGGWF